MNQDNNFQPLPDQEFSSNVLIERLRNLLRPPVFENDVDKTRKARVINSLLIAALVISLLFSLILLINAPSPGLPFAFLSIIQVAMVGGLIAIRRGNVSGSATFATFFIWLFIAIQSTLFGQVANPLLPSLILVIFLAGLVISSRAAIYYAVLSVLFTVALTVISQNELVPAVYESSNITFSTRIGAAFLLMAIFVYIANQTEEELAQKLGRTENALAKRNEEFEDLKNYLEQTVKDNTRQLEHRNKYLEAAASIAQTSISTLNLQDMLENIVAEISRELNFYHVGIFLLEERKKWAVLRAASSEGGKKMIARSHRLAVGKQGIVGFVTSIGQARISKDVDLDRFHSVTPELPETRAEMTLPLKVRDEIIGAIDIQDSNPDAFSSDDMAVMQTMADQIALAVENIRLFEQAQESLAEINRVYGEYSHQAWLEAYQKNLLSSYRYSGGAVSKISGEVEQQVTGKKVSIPVRVRGFIIGNIELSKDDDERDWTDDELKLLRSLSDQLGVALDSARLFNETQLRATTEQVISEINSQLWETMDINTILKTTAANLRDSLSLPELTIRMTAPESRRMNVDNETAPENAESD